MADNQNRTIFFIKDSLESIESCFTLNSDSINFIPIAIDEIDKIETEELNKNKENSLILVKYDVIRINKNLKQIINYFSEKFSFGLPHIIYLLDEDISKEAKKSIKIYQNFYYYLPSASITDNKKDIEVYNNNFSIYINNLFNNFLSDIRLNSYIIDSFQQIVDSQIISEQKNKIEELNIKLERLSRTDPLTELLNRRAFFEKFEEERERTIREKMRIKDPVELEALKKQNNIRNHDNITQHYGRLSCILLDIDHFKKINDIYGHQVGDQVLKKLGQFLLSKKIFRETDTAGRYGGEEFVIILPQTGVNDAVIPAKRLSEQIKNHEFYDENGKPFNVTISIGISEYLENDQSKDDIINRADKALYYAKEHGRDQVIVYEESMIE